jgi:hypothetical protein
MPLLLRLAIGTFLFRLSLLTSLGTVRLNCQGFCFAPLVG